MRTGQFFSPGPFVANVNSRSRSLGYVLSPVRLSSVCLSSVCCLSYVTLVRPTQPVKIFGNFLQHLVPRPSANIHEKFYGDCPWGTLRAPSGELNATGVAKYSDFGPIEGYISETVQDRRYVSINH